MSGRGVEFCSVYSKESLKLFKQSDTIPPLLIITHDEEFAAFLRYNFLPSVFLKEHISNFFLRKYCELVYKRVYS